MAMTKRQLNKLKKEPHYKLYLTYKRQFTKERSHKGASMKGKPMTYLQFQTYMGVNERVNAKDKQYRANKISEGKGSLIGRKRSEKDTRYTIWERDAKEAYEGYKAQYEATAKENRAKRMMSEKAFIAKHMERKAKDVAYREVMNVKGFSKKAHQRMKAFEREVRKANEDLRMPQGIFESFLMEVSGLQVEQADGTTMDISETVGTKAFLDLFNEWLKKQGYANSYDRAEIITLDMYGSPN